MKYLLLFLAIIFGELHAQSCFRYQKYPIGNSGCFAYFGTKPDSTEVSKMEDGAHVYTTQTTCNNITFGVLLVKFYTPNKDENNWDNLLISYMDVLKEMLEVSACAGYGKGHTHIENNLAHGILDYCEDAKKNQLSFKGWIDSNCAAIMYISYPESEESSIPYSPTQELFLNGFRFK